MSPSDRPAERPEIANIEAVADARVSGDTQLYAVEHRLI